jgi:hypothetical protein
MDLTALSKRFEPLVCPFCEVQSTRPTCRPGQAVRVEGGRVAPGQVESMGIGDTSFRYTPAAGSRPSLTVATDDADGQDGYYVITNLSLGAGFTFSLEQDVEGRVVFDSDDPDARFDVDVSLEDEYETYDYSFHDVTLDDNGQATLDLDGMFDTDDEGDEDSRSEDEAYADEADEDDEYDDDEYDE